MQRENELFSESLAWKRCIFFSRKRKCLDTLSVSKFSISALLRWWRLIENISAFFAVFTRHFRFYIVAREQCLYCKKSYALQLMIKFILFPFWELNRLKSIKISLYIVNFRWFLGLRCLVRFFSFRMKLNFVCNSLFIPVCIHMLIWERENYQNNT